MNRTGGRTSRVVFAFTVPALPGGPGGAVQINPAAVGIGVLDSDVTLGRGNLIVVGGPCVNTIAAELMDNPTDCAEGFTPGKADGCFTTVGNPQDGNPAID